VGVGDDVENLWLTLRCWGEAATYTKPTVSRVIAGASLKWILELLIRGCEWLAYPKIPHVDSRRIVQARVLFGLSGKDSVLIAPSRYFCPWYKKPTSPPTSIYLSSTSINNQRQHHVSPTTQPQLTRFSHFHDFTSLN